MKKKLIVEKISLQQINLYQNRISRKMKVVILAGGYGTRLSEYTKFIPKPMVKIRKNSDNNTYYKAVCEIWI